MPVLYYSYVEPFTGRDAQNIRYPEFNAVKPFENINLVAIAHTHATVVGNMSSDFVQTLIFEDKETLMHIAKNKENYSKKDKDSAKKLKTPNYLITPTGKLKIYNPNAHIFKEKEISNNMPYDPILDFIGYFE